MLNSQRTAMWDKHRSGLVVVVGGLLLGGVWMVRYWTRGEASVTRETAPCCASTAIPPKHAVVTKTNAGDTTSAMADPPASTHAGTMLRLPAPSFRVCAMLRTKRGDVSVGLVDTATRQYALVGIGESFHGYRVESIDIPKEEVQMTCGGELYIFKLHKGALEGSTSPPDPEETRLRDAWLAAIGAEPLVATPEERESRIDPNAPATWPLGYKGPGIEDALSVMAVYTNSEGVVAPSVGMASEKLFGFSATQSEIARGIDPNDNSTWPEDYKGPGIERMIEQDDGRGGLTETLTGP
jgi:hypothetical protein